MKNKKGFTLIEMLAVVVILGIMVMIATLGVSNYIDSSKRKMYIHTAKEYIKIASDMLAKNDLIARDDNTVYYFHINNLETGTGSPKQSPYGKWVDAYVVVVIKEDKSFVYYWTSVDETGHRVDLTEEKDLSISKIYVTDNKVINNSFPIGGRDNITIVDEDGEREKTEPTITMDADAAANCYEWDENADGTIIITNYNAACGTDIDIPSKIGGKTVTEIGEKAFKNKGITNVRSYAGVKTIGYGAFQGNKINSVKLSKSVVTIGDYAFYNSKIQSLILSENVKTIGAWAFASNHICQVYFPASLTTIGEYAFQGNCLTNIDLNSNATINSSAFSNNNLSDENAFIYKTNADGGRDFSTIIGYGGTNKNNLVIPPTSNGVALKTIAAGAFQSGGLTGSVTIPDTVESIGSSAFAWNSITSVNLPANLKTIGSSAFRSNRISEFNIPDSCYSIGNSAFTINNVTGDDAIVYKRVKNKTTGEGEWDYTTIVSYAGGYKEGTVTIPAQKNGVKLKSIGSSAFADCKLTKITLPDLSQTDKLTIPNNVFARNRVADNSKFMYRVNNGAYDYSYLSSYAGTSSKNTPFVLPATAPNGTPLKTVGAALTWMSYSRIEIPSSVETIVDGAIAKSARNNQNLTTIVNKTGRAFNWGNITSSNYKPQSMETGTIRHHAGNIEVVAE